MTTVKDHEVTWSGTVVETRDPRHIVTLKACDTFGSEYSIRIEFTGSFIPDYTKYEFRHGKTVTVQGILNDFTANEVKLEGRPKPSAETVSSPLTLNWWSASFGLHAQQAPKYDFDSSYSARTFYFLAKLIKSEPRSHSLFSISLTVDLTPEDPSGISFSLFLHPFSLLIFHPQDNKEEVRFLVPKSSSFEHFVTGMQPPCGFTTPLFFVFPLSLSLLCLLLLPFSLRVLRDLLSATL
jgi:hypothetical protein